MSVWPWEHLAVAYLLYAVTLRLLRSRPPGAAETWALALGSQVPDLVDKPLAWTFHLLPSGVSLAHSVFVAVPAVVAVRIAAGRRGAAPAGAAFGVGYLSHLPADLVYPLAFGDPFTPAVVLWPLVTAGAPAPGGLLANVGHYAVSSLARLGTPRGAGYLLAELLLLGTAATRWAFDGLPGVPAAFRRGGHGDGGR